MIYPTRRMVLAAGAVAPLALLVGIAFPLYWTAGLALLVLIVAAAAVDAFAGVSLRPADVGCDGPGVVGVGERFAITVTARFQGGAPGLVEIAGGVAGPVSAPFGWRQRARMSGNLASATIQVEPERRGTARVETLWIRWQGSLGLVWSQKRIDSDRVILIMPDIRPVRERSAQLLNREASYGIKSQLHVGEGAEFEALTDYRQGMDRRSIDWKTSARHTKLIAREYRTERNNNIVMALDSGRAMCEPIDGVPRIDRAITAALLTAFVALKDGDRVGLYAFDSRPRASSAPIAGPRAFPLLQRVAAGVDYSPNETNYTLALSTLAANLNRRSLIVIFTDFADTISAEMMLGAVGRLLKRHLVLFVVLREEELEGFTAAEPTVPDDVSRAVTAAALLRERRLVLTRLRHLGVHVIEAPAAEAGPALVNAYLDFKRRSLI